MSIQGDIEAALVTMIEAEISGMSATAGPTTVPKLEGQERAAAVRMLGGRSDRLDFGQNQWREQYALTLYWHSTIARDTIVTEWEAFAAALIADQYLGGAVLGLEDAYLTDTAWGDAQDASFRVLAAVVEVVRVD